MAQLDLHRLSANRFRHAMLWALFLSLFIVVAAALLGRATRSLQAAITDKPDIAIYLLLPDMELANTTLLRVDEDGMRRHYLTQSEYGPTVVRIRKNADTKEWEIEDIEYLRE